ncbi:uncharacterized protein LOC127003737 [Eriocheir sinensis]|uniref:uncharacterized protein LOC127003737 n=1 Tax=Eriocheir sinensis TaxID=95602 RepID=UPI0021C99F37|nr:uncharacterized protein LOC127003737 [Eriocheir sinensis]
MMHNLKTYKGFNKLPYCEALRRKMRFDNARPARQSDVIKVSSYSRPKTSVSRSLGLKGSRLGPAAPAIRHPEHPSLGGVTGSRRILHQGNTLFHGPSFFKHKL